MNATSTYRIYRMPVASRDAATARTRSRGFNGRAGPTSARARLAAADRSRASGTSGSAFEMVVAFGGESLQG